MPKSATTAVPTAIAQPMMAVVVPPGIRAGGVFNIQLPSGETRDVTCPYGASEGQLLQAWRLLPSVDAPPAEPGAVLAKLPQNAIVLGKPPILQTAPGDGETFFSFTSGISRSHGMWGEQEVTDVDGERFGKVIYSSNNLEKGQCSVRIVAVDGSVLASFDKPKEASVQEANLEAQGFGVTVFLGDLPYANVVAEAMRPNGAGHMTMVLTHASGLGGMAQGERAVVLVQPASGAAMTPIALTEVSDMRERRLVPLMGYKSTVTCAFAEETIPDRLAQIKGRLHDDQDAKPIEPLEDPARLDAFLLAVINQAACLLRAGPQ